MTAVHDSPIAQIETPIAAPIPSASAPYFDALRSYLPASLHDHTEILQSATDKATGFLGDGGPSIWAIAALSVITVALVL